MAAALLKAWNAPDVVTEVHLEVRDNKAKAASTVNTKVSDLNVGPVISWKQADEALPMPINLDDAPTKLALKSSDFVETLDRQILKVSGLTAAKYALSINDSDVGQFTAAELESGINLATLNTPMFKQALEVHRLTIEHNDVHFNRWRNVQVRYKVAKSGEAALQKALDGLDALEESLVEQQRDAAKPMVTNYKLRAL